jgi:SWI/SNF-related matrix-associated actin-dependent regulator 1 of chromatin subfamily A
MQRRYVKLKNNILKFHTEYNYSLKEELKNLGCKWNGSEVCWEYSLKNKSNYEGILNLINSYNIRPYDEQTENTLTNMKNELRKREYLYKLSSATEPTIDIEIKTPKGLKLYDYQKVGIQYIQEIGGKALIADEMGLGKTIQALTYLYNHPELRPVLIICPASLKINWKREIKKWTEEESLIISTNTKISKDFNYYIINYDILSKKLKELKEMGFKTLILDEAHYIKNKKAKRTKAVLELSQQIQSSSVIALTGTPVLNKPVELFNILVALGKIKENKFWDYANLYCDPKEIYIGNGRYITLVDGASNLDQLNAFLRSRTMIRRLKKDVLNQLPPKRRIKINIDIENRKEYEDIENRFIEWYISKGGIIDSKAELLQKIEALRKIALEGKLKQTIEFIINTYENEKKVVVFAHHRHSIEQIYDELRKLDYNLTKIIGGMKVEEKQNAIDRFNNSEEGIILISVRAGGEGINLQSAKVGIFVEMDWTPAMLLQAEDRLHRIGQNKTVDIYYIIAENTVEEHIFKIVQEKAELTKEILDTANNESEGFEILKEMANIYSLPAPKLVKKKRAGRKKGLSKISLDTIIRLVSVLSEDEEVSNKELAERLGVSPPSVIDIRKNLKSMGELNILIEENSKIRLSKNWRSNIIKFIERMTKI